MARPKAHPEWMYKTNRHCCYNLQYHLVLVTKYRHPVISGDLENRLNDIIKQLLKNFKCESIEINSNKDHVHILFEAPPQVSLSVLINNLKTVTSRRLRKEFAKELEPYYWKPYFWSESYFIGTVNERTTDIVQQYIQNQKEKNARALSRRNVH